MALLPVVLSAHLPMHQCPLLSGSQLTRTLLPRLLEWLFLLPPYCSSKKLLFLLHITSLIRTLMTLVFKWNPHPPQPTPPTHSIALFFLHNTNQHLAYYLFLILSLVCHSPIVGNFLLSVLSLVCRKSLTYTIG